jgi:hypothetical protein
MSACRIADCCRRAGGVGKAQVAQGVLGLQSPTRRPD